MTYSTYMQVKNKKQELECSKCGHTWETRKQNPKACPRCKRYDYKEELLELTGE